MSVSLPANLSAAARAIAGAAGYDLVVLFGSAARGEPAPRDLDIGVLSRGPVDLLDATNRFVEVYEAHRSTFNEFVSLVMRRYADTRKFRDAVREQLQEYAARHPA